MLNFIVTHGFGKDKSPLLPNVIAETLSLPLDELEERWIDASLLHAGPSILLDPTALVSASVRRFTEQVQPKGGQILGSWSVVVMPDTAPTGLMLAFVREIERCTGNAPGVVVVEKVASAFELVHVSDLPLRVRCRIGDTLVVVRNIWLHYSEPFLHRGSRVTITALDGPDERLYGNCVTVVDEEGAQLLLPWCLVVPLSEWADGAYPNSKLGEVPPRIYPNLIPFLQHGGSDLTHFWYDWPAVKPVGVAPSDGGMYTTVRFDW